MDRIKKNKMKVIGYLIVTIVLLFSANWLYKNRRVHFEDDKMRQVICLELGKDKDSQNVTYRELERLKELEIGPVGAFETIEDIAKCKNLKKLWINVEITDRDISYKVFEKTEKGKVYYPTINEKKLVRMQGDLAKILKKNRCIDNFGLSNVNESFDITSIDFLKYAKNVKRINISYVNIENYSFLKECKKIESIDLEQSKIESASELLQLKNINRIVLTGTPLAENKKEINRLKKAFPEADIIVD